MKTYSILIVLLFAYSNVFTQENERVNSSENINEAYDKYLNEEVDEALRLLDEINRSDTNYTLALVNKSYYCLNDDRYEEVLKVTDAGLNHFDEEYKTSFIVNKGIALGKLERYDEAIEHFTDALEKYPVRNEFYTLMGSVYEEKGDHEKALEMYKKSIEMNLFDPDPHIRLGRMAYHEGKTSQFLMGFLMGILIDPNSSSSNTYLVSLNQLVQAKAESQEPKGLKFSDKDTYDEIDLILQNYSALNKSYKLDSKIDIPLTRQIQVLMEKLEYDSSSDGFWMKTYVRVLKDIYDTDQFAAFTYHLLQSSGNSKHQKIITKNNSSIANLTRFLQDKLSDYCAENPIVIEGEEKNYHRLITNSLITSAGGYQGNDFHGPWYLFYDSGALSAKGFYDNGKAIGTWTWFYETGEKRREYTLKNEVIDGTLFGYYKNGQISVERNFKNGFLDGVERMYTATGKEISYIEYEMDKADGKAIKYYDIAMPEYEYELKDDRIIGDVKYFYDSGEQQGIFSYSDGRMNGDHKIFYRNGQLGIEKKFSNGKLEGKWRSYYKDGKVKETANYKNDKIFGKNEVFDSEGNLIDETIYDENGKKNGTFIEYHENGKPYYKSEFKKGVMTEYNYYSQNGDVLESGEVKKNGTEFKGYYMDGTPYSIGLFKPEGRDGEWKLRNEYGFEDVVMSYDNGDREGDYVEYFENGEISVKSTYMDNKREGYYVSYYPDGKIHQEGYYKDGELDGAWDSYSSAGAIVSSEYYLNGKRHGFLTYFDPEEKRDYEVVYNYDKVIGYISYDADGNIMQKIDLEDGCGTVVLNFRNGAKRFETNFLNHIEHGKVRSYTPDGTVIREGEIYNAQRHGKWINRFDNGNTLSEGVYEYGDKVGIWKIYHENGELRETEEWKDGRLHETNTVYDKNGKLSNVIIYKEGERNGPCVFYIDGVKEHTRYYKDGKFIEYSYWLPSGEESEKIRLKDGTGIVKSYYQNGNLAREYSMLNGQFDGPYKRYFENGNLERETHNDVGYDTKITKEYFKSGKLKIEYENANNDRNGYYKEYYENGKLAEEGNYVDGYEHGEFKYYDQQGNLTKTTVYYDGNAY